MKGNGRFEVRKSYSGPVDLVAGLWDDSVTYVCGDMSPRGAFLKTSFPLSLGETVVCTFRLPGSDREYDLFGRVVRVDMPRRKTDRGESGMGIRFVGTTPMERLLIRECLRRLPPPIPGHLRKAA